MNTQPQLQQTLQQHLRGVPVSNFLPHPAPAPVQLLRLYYRVLNMNRF